MLLLFEYTESLELPSYLNLLRHSFLQSVIYFCLQKQAHGRWESIFFCKGRRKKIYGTEPQTLYCGFQPLSVEGAKFHTAMLCEIAFSILDFLDGLEVCVTAVEPFKEQKAKMYRNNENSVVFSG